MAKRRKQKKLKLTLPVLILLIIGALIYGAFYIYDNYFNKPDPVIMDGSIQLHYIDVGQGDATLIIAPSGEAMLIDAGINESEKHLLDYLDRYNITKLEYAVFTHYDADHIEGGDAVLDKLEVSGVIMPDYYDVDTSCAQKLYAAVEAENASVIHPSIGKQLRLGDDVEIEILSDGEIIDKGKNDDSIVLMITFGNKKFLFSGDAEEKREERVLATAGDKLDADVFQAGHHCSYTANNADFLAAVTPEIVVVSCGKDNSYQHPHQAAIDRISVYTTNILRTDLLGDIVITSDGNTVSQNKTVLQSQNVFDSASVNLRICEIIAVIPKQFGFASIR